MHSGIEIVVAKGEILCPGRNHNLSSSNPGLKPSLNIAPPIHFVDLVAGPDGNGSDRLIRSGVGEALSRCYTRIVALRSGRRRLDS